MNNGSIFESDQARLKQNLTDQQFLDIVSHLSCQNPQNFDLQQFKYELKITIPLPKIKINMENTSLDKCLVLKKAFRKKDNFFECELQESATKISSLQGTVSGLQQCVLYENTL